MIITQCCVCGKVMKLSYSEKYAGQYLYSHGYCKPCVEDMLEKIKDMKPEAEMDRRTQPLHLGAERGRSLCHV